MFSLPSPQVAADARPTAGAHAAPAGWRRWPLPAVGAWLACWTGFLALRPLLGDAPAGVAALLLAGALALRQRGWARRTWVAAGFPLSAALWQGAAGWPAWVWLLPPALLLAVYPLRAWRDAPLFPTPPDALRPLAAQLPLAPGAAVLDAGCGAGDGLRALQAAWPQARLGGIEWSWPLALLSRWRCRAARVRRGDMWCPGAWQGQDLVYLFQRPESMGRAWAKACAELPGGWLVSLEFAVPGRTPDLRAVLPGGRELMAWRVPAAGAAAAPGAPATRAGHRAQPGAAAADKTR